MATDNERPRPTSPAEGGVEAGSPASDWPPALQDLQTKLEQAESERAQFRAMAQRAQADLINYRQRVEREGEESRRAGMERAITKLLPIVDDVQMALQHTPAHGSEAAWLAWVEGIRLIERRLAALLESEGVTPIAAEGKPFDPFAHEALFQVNDPSKPPGVVVMVTRQGYKINDKVLRAAQVGISQQPESQEARAQATEAGSAKERKES